MPSLTPSLTSVSDGDGEDDSMLRERDARDAAFEGLGRWSGKDKGKGKAKAAIEVAASGVGVGVEREMKVGMAGESVPEVLIHVSGCSTFVESD
jgi:hypothetical protein